MAIQQVKRPNREVSQSATEAKRPRRNSFDRSGPMAVDGGPPDKKLRFVNDVRNRVRQALEMGYTFVHKDSVVSETDVLNTSTEMGTALTRVAGFDPRTNTPIIAYLMAIDLDMYNEQQAYKQEDDDEIMKALGERQKNSVPGSYVPK